jgi:hypothetical protein
MAKSLILHIFKSYRRDNNLLSIIEGGLKYEWYDPKNPTAMLGEARPSLQSQVFVHAHARGDVYIGESVICTKSDINNLFPPLGPFIPNSDASLTEAVGETARPPKKRL